MSTLKKLFEPFEYNSLQLANRIVMPAMTRNFSPNHIPNEKVVEYYRRRAAAGVGLIITEGTCIDHKAANGFPNVPFMYGEDALGGWKRVVEAVHAEGGKIAPQLWHVGSVRRPGTEPYPEVSGHGPSGMAAPGKVTGHTMTSEDIQDVIAAFGQGARDAQEVGFDCVEIHGAHGYLIDQFFWEDTNHREDEYGGSLANRSRFAIEIIKEVRTRVGSDFPIIFRWSQWKQQDYAARLVDSPDALAQFLQPMVDAGVDIFHCSTRRFWEPAFSWSSLNLAGWSKKLTGKPCIAVGSVGLDNDFLPEGDRLNADFKNANPASLDKLLESMAEGEFDLISVGRALIANPDWPQLIRENKTSEIRPYTKELLYKLM